jgi:hypothetical protein
MRVVQSRARVRLVSWAELAHSGWLRLEIWHTLAGGGGLIGGGGVVAVVVEVVVEVGDAG